MKQEKVLSLIEAFVDGNKQTIDTRFRQLLADFDDKSSWKTKQSFERQYNTFKNGTGKLIQLPQRLKRFVFDSYVPAHMQDLLLPESVMEAVTSLEKEYRHRKTLQENGLTNMNKMLLIGPPGNGKTSFAIALAEQLGIPPYIVATGLLIDSHLGESGNNITSIFKDVPSDALLFIDEFDTLATARDHGGESADKERNNIVNGILMALDRLSEDVIFVAATNRNDLLDKAIMSRFDITLNFPSPSSDQIDRYVKKYQDKYRVNLDINLERLHQYNSYRTIEKALKHRHKEIILNDINVITDSETDSF